MRVENHREQGAVKSRSNKEGVLEPSGNFAYTSVLLFATTPPMSNFEISNNSATENSLTSEQVSLVERNLELSVDERINQLQSAVELIEEMRNSLKERNEDRF